MPVLPWDEHDEGATIANFANGYCYVSSFHVSQKDMFESVKRVTGTTDAHWTISYESHVDRLERARQIFATGNRMGYGLMMYTTVMSQGGDGNAQDKSDNEALGLPQEVLDEWTKVGVDLGRSGVKY